MTMTMTMTKMITRQFSEEYEGIVSSMTCKV